MAAMKNIMIDKMNEIVHAPVVLRPDEEWLPGAATQIKKEENSCAHVWKKILLFQFYCEECIRCGLVRDAKRGDDEGNN